MEPLTDADIQAAFGADESPTLLNSTVKVIKAHPVITAVAVVALGGYCYLSYLEHKDEKKREEFRKRYGF